MVKFTVVSLLCFFSLTVKSQAEGMPILELYKKASPESAPPGGSITYTLTCENIGDEPATEVIIRDSLNTEFVDYIEGTAVIHTDSIKLDIIQVTPTGGTVGDLITVTDTGYRPISISGNYGTYTDGVIIFNIGNMLPSSLVVCEFQVKIRGAIGNTLEDDTMPQEIILNLDDLDMNLDLLDFENWMRTLLTPYSSSME
jgi:uncharacterized repeat protein (TIGR01451 family)